MLRDSLLFPQVRRRYRSDVARHRRSSAFRPGAHASVYKENAMKCPACPDAALVMTDRQGLEIDYCPQCRGVWLDRGELDKLIERSAMPRDDVRDDRDCNRRRQGPGDGRHGRRPKSWLSEIFD
jgi:Zn-finger nucleic acid-binding protein